MDNAVEGKPLGTSVNACSGGGLVGQVELQKHHHEGQGGHDHLREEREREMFQGCGCVGGIWVRLS